jgi:acyl-CoA synthetase (AMP-forming)/AMP-acid ligase II
MLSEGIGPGDLVALYLHNSAEFIMLMFATLCIGAGSAMINYNLEGKALLHCLDVCQSKLLIVDPDSGCQKRINDSRSQIEGAGTRTITLDEGLKTKVSSLPVVVPGDHYRNGMKGSWPYALIYTYGSYHPLCLSNC